MILFSALTAASLAAPTCSGPACVECLPGQQADADLVQLVRRLETVRSPSTDAVQANEIILFTAADSIHRVDLGLEAAADLLGVLQIPGTWTRGEERDAWTPTPGKRGQKHLATAGQSVQIAARELQVTATYAAPDKGRTWLLTKLSLASEHAPAHCSDDAAPWRMPTADASAWAAQSPAVQDAIDQGWTLHTALLARPGEPSQASVNVDGHDTIWVLTEGVGEHGVRFVRPELHSEAGRRVTRAPGTRSAYAYARVLIERIDVRVDSGRFGAVAAVLVKSGMYGQDVMLDELEAPARGSSQLGSAQVQHLMSLRRKDAERVSMGATSTSDTLRAVTFYDDQWAADTLGQRARELASTAWSISAHIEKAKPLTKFPACATFRTELDRLHAEASQIASTLDDVHARYDEMTSGNRPATTATVGRQTGRLRRTLVRLQTMSADFERVPLQTCGDQSIGQRP